MNGKCLTIFGFFLIFVQLSVAQLLPPPPADSCVGYYLGVIQHPDPTWCRYYIICLNNEPIELRSCDPGYIFIPRDVADPPYGECQPGERNFRVKKIGKILDFNPKYEIIKN